jgi:hypothetical protein
MNILPFDGVRLDSDLATVRSKKDLFNKSCSTVDDDVRTVNIVTTLF